MRKIVVVALVTLMAATLGLAACATGQPTAAEMKAPQVTFVDAYGLFGGKESNTLQADFLVKNPGTVGVTLDSFEFTLGVDDKNFGFVQNPNDFFIPAGGEIKVSGVAVVPFGNLVAELLLGQGMTSADATKAVLPYWKKMGGVLPVDAMKPIWDAVDPKVTWTASGTAYVVNEAQRMNTRFSLTLQR